MEKTAQDTGKNNQHISSNGAEAVPDRTADSNDEEVIVKELSKNALKKASKQEKAASEKVNKPTTKTVKEVAKAEAKRAVSKPAKKKIEGAALIGIDVAKEEDFSGWYQQVLTKGDMLDYYDVSGCYILKVGHPARYGERGQ